MATEPRHLHRLLAFFDPLLRDPSLVIKPHHVAAGCFQVGYDESDPREQLARMMLDLRHHPPGRLPTRRLVEKPLVFDQGLLAGSSYRAWQQFGNTSFQIVVGRYPNDIVHAALFQCLINLRLRKGHVGSERNFLSRRLLPLDLGQQEIFPTLSAVHIAWPQLGCQTVASITGMWG